MTTTSNSGGYVMAGYPKNTLTTGTTRIAVLCRERGLTRQQIIAATNISDRTLTRMFRDADYKGDRALLLKMANLLGVHPLELQNG